MNKQDTLYISILKSCLTLLFAFAFFIPVLPAQTLYPMTNATVSDCRGLFTDSDGNTVTSGDYGHNENYTFTICVPGADSIVMSFTSFCTEASLDVIRFFDGADTLSPMIGLAVSGPTAMPGVIVSTSGCLTIHWKSDASVSCTGWEASWYSIINTPAAPIISPIPNPACNSNSITLTFDQLVLCDSVDASDFVIAGPLTPTIVTAVPIGCVGGYTNTVQLNFSAIDVNGTYNIICTTIFKDACESIWELSSFASFTVNSCPLKVIISATDTTICEGACTDLTATAYGSTTGAFTYSWSAGIPAGPGPHTVCPLLTTIYYVTVTDGIAPPGYDTFTVFVTPLPTMPNDTTLCQSHYAGIPLSASPAGGSWSGPGIPSSGFGRFYPSWLGPGTYTITYTVNGCSNTMNITVNAAFAGWYSAVCPGTAPYVLTGASPPGGFWRGPGIVDSVTGLFDPDLAGIGSFTIYYTVPGCPLAQRTINVDSIRVPNDTIVCENTPAFNLSFSPLGGSWSGTGITNSFWGTFNAGVAGAGTHALRYAMNGCSDTVFVTVQDIWAGWDRTACPSMDDDTLSILSGAFPSGGVWWGTGIIDSAMGIFDPQASGGSNFTATIYYSLNGCTDTMNVYNYYTDIGIDPLPAHCPQDSVFLLSWSNTHRNLWGGIWTGTGIVDSTDYGSWDPVLAGPGTHRLYYHLNGCTDSALITVHPDPDLRDTSVCLAQSPFSISSSGVVGSWSGSGIINPANGMFSASVAGTGNHLLVFTSMNGCKDSMIITVTAMPVISISGLDPVYCFNDSLLNLVGSPVGGSWSGTPLLAGNTFNPIAYGPGTYSFIYNYGSGDCAVSGSVSTTVLSEIVLSTNFRDTIICAGELIRISAEASGGSNPIYHFDWSSGLGSGTSHVVEVLDTTAYIVTVDDGCTRAETASIVIFTMEPMEVSFTTDTIQCYDQASFAAIEIMPGGGLYDVSWQYQSISDWDTIVGAAGHYYQLEVRDLLSGCYKDTSVFLPGWEEVIAHFSTSPNDHCADLKNPRVQFLDQSEGGTKGWWYFDDGISEDYIEGADIYHTYSDIGEYTVMLKVMNEAGCLDYYEQEVCIDPYSEVILPTAFTPNGDQMNDIYRVHGWGLQEIVFRIYDRMGEVLFETKDPAEGWDGNYKGRAMPMGVYVYLVTYLDLKTNSYKSISGNVTLLR